MQKKTFTPERYLTGNKLALVTSGEPYFVRLLQIINDAQKHIYFQVYIFDNDRTGKEVIAALKKAQQRGVDVFLAVDSYGSKSLSPEFIADLRHNGLYFKLFSPLPDHFYAFRLGRRLHSKVVVADGAVALVGGINIADKYRGNEKDAPWLDFALDVRGPICIGLLHFCERIFRGKYFGKHTARRAITTIPSLGAGRCKLAVNDWFRRKNQISAGYRASFREAQYSITILASYFLPSRSIRTALKNAARRGVLVKILLPGKSDVPLAKRATRYLYQWLLRNNIGIYEWHDSIVHGKLAVVDSKWVTIGSYNLNHLSQYSSIEMNVEVLDEPFASTVQETLSTLMQQSTSITPGNFNNIWRKWDQALDWASYTLARWMMLFLFFLVQREHRYKEKE